MELQMHTHFPKHGFLIFLFFSTDTGHGWWKNIVEKGKQHVPTKKPNSPLSITEVMTLTRYMVTISYQWFVPDIKAVKLDGKLSNGQLTISLDLQVRQ